MNEITYYFVLIKQAEVILKIRADFSPSVTANTVAVQMPLPSYTTRLILFIYFIPHYYYHDFVDD